MSALYAPHVEWLLPPSTPFPRPKKGRETVIAFNRGGWTKYYRPDRDGQIGRGEALAGR